MTKRIQSYSDLLSEKERLEVLLNVQKETLRRDIYELKEEIREEIEPIRSFVSFTAKLVRRDGSNPILNAGVDTLINLIVKKLILSRAGWLTKRIVPFLLKNFSSHIIAENKEALLDKLFSWVGKKNANGHEKVI